MVNVRVFFGMASVMVNVRMTFGIGECYGECQGDFGDRLVLC